MTSISTATGAPSQITVGGKTWLLKPLLDDDYGVLENWVRDRYVDVTKRNVKDLNESDRRFHIDKAIAEAREIDVDSKRAAKMINTPPGVVQVLWLSLKHNHPEITLEETRKLCMNNPEFDEAMDGVLGGGVADVPKKKRVTKRMAKRPKKASRAKRRK